jgi:hypothetical protein
VGPGVDLLPAGVDARTAAHEYGGGACWARELRAITPPVGQRREAN